VADFWLIVWAAVPPFLLLGYYYHRVPLAPPFSRLLLLFIAGAISGFAALSLELLFETVANWIIDWQGITRSLLGAALRQMIEIGPIEEGSKLVGVVVPTAYFHRKYRLFPTSIFLFTIAVALGFTAEENWVYFFHGTASIWDRSLGTPVHAMFSAPWGYALSLSISSSAMRFRQRQNLLPQAWMNSVICHALVNIFSISWRYPPPLRFLNYALFPFLLWMFWRLEKLLRKVQGKSSLILISGLTRQHRFWQRCLLLFALFFGGNALFELFLLARTISPLSPIQILSPEFIWMISSRFFVNLMIVILAAKIFLYLRNSARKTATKCK
jgi:RsiW-degrading membrane proteinase PrsW (M82 family)